MMIGLIGTKQVPELTFTIHSEFANQGYMTEALHAFVGSKGFYWELPSTCLSSSLWLEQPDFWKETIVNKAEIAKMFRRWNVKLILITQLLWNFSRKLGRGRVRREWMLIHCARIEDLMAASRGISLGIWLFGGWIVRGIKWRKLEHISKLWWRLAKAHFLTLLGFPPLFWDFDSGFLPTAWKANCGYSKEQEQAKSWRLLKARCFYR